MEQERKVFHSFLALHANKGMPSEAPVVYVGFRDELSANQQLVAMTRDEVCEEFEPDTELVRWLLHQMSTYNCRTQKILALVFDSRTILSDVLRC